MLFIFLVVLAYLMGSICSAVIVCKSCSLPDPRTEGSKNPGATNVLRLAGKQYASLVMAVDLLKGTIPVLIAKALGADLTLVSFTALAAVIGHTYPIFFQFKGGKGVATAIGALLGLQLFVGILVAATWALVAKFSRYSSLASITSIGLAPFYSLLLIQNINVFLPVFIITLLILYKHKENIIRLIDGKEPKIKLKKNVLEDILEEEHHGENHHENPKISPSQTNVETVSETPKTKKVAKTTKATAKSTNKKEPVSEKKASTTKKSTSLTSKTEQKDEG